MHKNAKQLFFEEAIRKRDLITVYTVDSRGICSSLDVQPGRAQWTLSNFGFVQFDLSMRDNAWVNWASVFHMVAGQKHCVDWSRIPKTMLLPLGGWSITDAMHEYKRLTRGVVWFGAVSVGPAPQLAGASKSVQPPLTRTQIRARARGWRVIQGGAA